VSATVTPIDVFQYQSNALILQFKSATIQEFLFSLKIVVDTTQTNSFFSIHQTNAKAEASADGERVLFKPVVYDGCSCLMKSTCTSASVLYDLSTNRTLFIIPGMSNGCYVVEALLRSNLQCFYNSTCFEALTTYFNESLPSSIRVMNASASSNYSVTSNVSELLDNLMVEDWSWSSTYTNYFTACQPSECSYTVQSRNDAIYIVTTLAGLIGGLTTGIKLILPSLLQLLRYITKKRNRIVSNNTNVRNENQCNDIMIGISFLKFRDASVRQDSDRSLPPLADARY
jgi:hypothetical protein